MEVKKLHPDNAFTISERINLDRYVHQTYHKDHLAAIEFYDEGPPGEPHSQRQSNTFELIGIVLQAGFRKPSPLKGEVSVKQEQMLLPSKTAFVQPICLSDRLPAQDIKLESSDAAP